MKERLFPKKIIGHMVIDCAVEEMSDKSTRFNINLNIGKHLSKEQTAMSFGAIWHELQKLIHSHQADLGEALKQKIN